MIVKRLLIFAIFLCNSYVFSQSRDSLVALFLQEPNEEFEAIKCEKDWEQNFHYATMLQVGEKYVMYYRSFDRNTDTKLLYCYAESQDGIHWIKPDWGLFEYAGNKNNNIISDRFNGASFEYNDGIFYMLADGMTEFVECGPGTVLTELIGRIQKSLT